VALTAGGAVEVQREISDTGAHGGSAPAPQVRSLSETPPPPRPPDAGLTPSSSAAETAKPALKVKTPTAATTAPTAQETPVTAEPDPAPAPASAETTSGDTASTGGAQAPADLADDSQTSSSGATDKPKATGAGGDATTAPALPLTSAENPAPSSGGGSSPYS
jgi:hypothetical protein